MKWRGLALNQSLFPDSHLSKWLVQKYFISYICVWIFQNIINDFLYIFRGCWIWVAPGLFLYFYKLALGFWQNKKKASKLHFQSLKLSYEPLICSIQIWFLYALDCGMTVYIQLAQMVSDIDRNLYVLLLSVYILVGWFVKGLYLYWTIFMVNSDI